MQQRAFLLHNLEHKSDLIFLFFEIYSRSFPAPVAVTKTLSPFFKFNLPISSSLVFSFTLCVLKSQLNALS